MATTPKTKTPKAPAATVQAPEVETVAAAKSVDGVPGEDATADELAYFIRHNPVFMTLGHEARNALTQRLIDAKRQA